MWTSLCNLILMLLLRIKFQYLIRDNCNILGDGVNNMVTTIRSWLNLLKVIFHYYLHWMIEIPDAHIFFFGDIDLLILFWNCLAMYRSFMWRMRIKYEWQQLRQQNFITRYCYLTIKFNGNFHCHISNDSRETTSLILKLLSRIGYWRSCIRLSLSFSHMKCCTCWCIDYRDNFFSFLIVAMQLL